MKNFPIYGTCPGPTACIKHQREIHGPLCCGVFTVTTGTFDGPRKGR